MSSTVIPTNSSTPIIEFQAPGQTAPATVYVPQTASAPRGLQAFVKDQLKSLGTIQILISLLILLLGIAYTVNANSTFFVSGIPYWGSLIYIIAGSLCICNEAEKCRRRRGSKCRVKGSLAMNILSAITAGISIIILSLDLTALHVHINDCSDGECNNDNKVKHLLRGIIFVSLVSTILEFIISIVLSAFACKANGCCCSPPVPLVSDSSMNHNPADESSDPKYEY
ncbi:unnamed protein product [Leuciscus chuanchicus]